MEGPATHRQFIGLFVTQDLPMRLRMKCSIQEVGLTPTEQVACLLEHGQATLAGDQDSKKC